MGTAKRVTTQNGGVAPRKRASGKTTIQQDAEQSMLDRGFGSPVALVKDGLLNPNAFQRNRHTADFKHKAESERIVAAMTQWVNEHHGLNGAHRWTVGMCLVADYGTHENQALTVDEVMQSEAAGWRILRPEILGPKWSESLQRKLGLVIKDGALAWPGRGGMREFHLLMVIPSDILIATREERSRESQASTEPLEDGAGIPNAEPYIQKRETRTATIPRDEADDMLKERAAEDRAAAAEEAMTDDE